MTELQITSAVKHFKKGAVVIFPTETVLGIGCSIDHENAIDRVYKIKARDKNQPTHVLVSSLEMAQRYGEFSRLALKLVKHFWPGPLTIVVPLKPDQPEYLKKIANLSGGLGFRAPSFPDLVAIIKQLNTPILGPSANKKGGLPTSSPRMIDKEILSLVDYTIDLSSGGQKPSTIVEVSKYNWKVLRTGPITEANLNEALKEYSEHQVCE